MIIRKLVLENIRSYVNQTISFPEGTVLLSGDIGSGKSTILMAVEFALFGSSRINLKAGSLLRNGKKEGSVELEFDLDGRRIAVKRTLRRALGSITQDSGYIAIDGKKSNTTARELKSRVLGLLGYPKDTLYEQKNLLYRYTVFTPQEEMKAILFEADRLDILRKIFGFDRYKRIMENTGLLLRKMRENSKELKGMIADLPDKIKKRDKLREELRLKEEELKSKKGPLRQEREAVEAQKRIVESYVKRMREYERLKGEYSSLTSEANMLAESIAGKNREIQEISLQIRELKAELKDGPERESILKESERVEKSLAEADARIRELIRSKGGIESKEKEALKHRDRLDGYDRCPFCRQQIGDEYKKKIRLEQAGLLEEYDRKKREIEGKLHSLNLEKDKLKADKQELDKQLRRMDLDELKRKNIRDYESKAERLKIEADKARQGVKESNIKKISIKKKMESFEGGDTRLKKEKQSLAALEEKKTRLELAYARLEEGIHNLIRSIDDLSDEIDRKNKLKERHEDALKAAGWIGDIFRPMVAQTEKLVMSRIHSEFDELFQQWFSELLDDEGLQARLDEEFAPVITQNGYETDLASLSGGEKTGCALAYRLSLNKVINDMIRTISTRDILVLDEPTDGFSAEQLDKVRDVLDSLSLRQIILVSHESKIESYVDKVIRVHKEGHVSSVR